LGDEHTAHLGEVGTPGPGVHIKLENWEEGGYRVTDSQGARGEIVISVRCLAQGYYKCSDPTANSSFITDQDGKRWYRTGDIGSVNPQNGALRIVDRKKDLVKLQMGEYVSLGKVENALKLHPVVENVCVFASPLKTTTVALIVPDEVTLRQIHDREHGSSSPVTPSRTDLCNDERLRGVVLSELQAKVKGILENFETPRNIRLVADQWTPENGLITSAMKIRRKPIQKNYQDLIDVMYEEVAVKRSKKQ